MAMGYDGSIRIDTKLNSKGFNTGVTSMTGSLKKLVGAVGLAFSVTAIVNFSRESVKAASQLSSALIGLQSIVEGQGRSFSQAKGFVDSYIKDGLIPMQNAVTAYKNLAMRGYSTEQIEKTMIALKNASAFGRQASLTMGQAVSSATEGLKNENSILVDNAGVTKNVSVMWAEYAKQIGVGVQSLTKEQRIQAEVNGIMHETRFQMDDAAKVVNTYAGQVSMLSFNFTQLKVAVGKAITPIVQAALPAVNTLLFAMTNLADVAAQVTSALFGTSAIKDQAKDSEGLSDANGNAAGSASDLANATDDVGNSVVDASKKIIGATAPFDDLNQITEAAAKNIGDTVDGLDKDLNTDKVGGGTLFGDVVVSPEIMEFVENFKAGLQSIKDALVQIEEMFSVIGKSFMTVWDSGAGEKSLGLIKSIIDGIFASFGLLAERIGLAWAKNEMGIAIFQSIMNIINTVLALFNNLAQASFAWVASLNLDPLILAFKGFLKSMEPVVAIISGALMWAYENVLLPLSKWFIEKAAPAGLDLLSAALGMLSNVIVALEPFATWLWTTFLRPLAEWTGAVFIAAIEGITDAFNGFGAFARDNPEEIQKLAEVLFALFAGIVAYFTIQKIVTVIGAIKNALIAFAGGMATMNIPVMIAAVAIGSLVLGIMQLAGVWDSMTGAEKMITVLGVLAVAATTAAIAIAVFHTSMTMGIAAAAIAAGIAMVVASIVIANKSATSATQSIRHSSARSGSSGAMIPSGAMSAYPLPHLANGAVIPPNKQFTAVLGDQRSGTNIEAPLATIEQAVTNAMQRSGGGEVRMTVEMPVYLDGREIFRNQKVVSRQMGTSFVEGV